MKKLVYLLLVFLLLQFVFAYEIDLTKEEYYPGETLQAEIKGIEGINKEGITLYRNRNVPATFDFTKIDNRYYFYMVLPDKEGNYTLEMENVLIDNQIIGDIERNFTIKESNTSYISVDPGFIIALGDDFYIDVKNKGNEDVDVKASYGSQEESFSLFSKQEKRIRFDRENANSLTINNYVLPVIVDQEVEEEEEEIKESGGLKFIPDLIEGDFLIGQRKLFELKLINSGERKIEDISIDYPEDYGISIEPKSISELGKRNIEKINVSILLSQENEISFKIRAEAEDAEAEVLFKLDAVSIDDEGDYEPIIELYDQTCSELGGELCLLSEKCTGITRGASDGDCCIGGECESITSGSSKAWIGWIIVIVVVVGIGIFIIPKLRKSKNKKPEDIMKERQKK